MIAEGAVVRVLPPFQQALPDTYTVATVNAEGTCTLDNGADFDPIYLELVA